MVRYSAGIVTAYGAAKRAGYTGTYEDFCRQQAGYAANAQAVAQAKTDAQAAATNAANSATAAGTSATNAAGSATSAGSSATAAAGSATTAGQHKDAAAQSATNAAGSATAAAGSATAAAQSATAAQNVLNSIPSDYSQMSADVTQLKADLGTQSDSVKSVLTDGGIYTFSNAEVYETTSDRALKTSGSAVADSTAELKKYAVVAGDVLYLHLLADNAGTFQFQNSKSVALATNTAIIGSTYTGAADVVIAVPNGATYLIVSQSKTNTTNIVKKAVGNIEQIQNKIGSVQLDTTSQVLTGAINEVNTKADSANQEIYRLPEYFGSDFDEDYSSTSGIALNKKNIPIKLLQGVSYTVDVKTSWETNESITIVFGFSDETSAETSYTMNTLHTVTPLKDVVKINLWISPKRTGTGTITVKISTNGKLNDVYDKTGLIEAVPYKSVNLFDVDKAEQGVISVSNGAISENNKNGYELVPINETGTYATFVNSFRTGLVAALLITYFDEQKRFIDNISATAIGDTSELKYNQQAKFTVTDAHISAGLKYVGLNFAWSYRDSLMLVKGETYPQEYIPYYDYYAFGGMKVRPENFYFGSLNQSVLAMHSPLYKKKAVFDGDSICYGEGFVGGYAGIIKSMFDMDVQNNAVSGATITADTGVSHIIATSVANLDSDADYAILEGGVNDASISVSAPLGTYSASYTDTFDPATFYGALDTMFKSLVTRFAGKKYGFVITHQMANNMKWSNEESTSYYWAIVKSCKKWGVPYLDLNISVPPFNSFRDSGGVLDAVRNTYTDDGDGWHPTEDGYKKYYVPKIVSWMESL